MTLIELLTQVGNLIPQINHEIDLFQGFIDQFKDFADSNNVVLKRDANGPSYGVPANHPNHSYIVRRLDTIDSLKNSLNDSILSKFREAFEAEKKISELSPQYQTQLRGILDRMRDLTS